MTKRISSLLLAAATSLALAGCTKASEPSPSPDPARAAPAAATSSAGAARASVAARLPVRAAPAQHVDGLIKLAGLKALPAHDVSPTTGYPGSGFHYGVFKTAAQWNKYAKAAGIGRNLTVDWRTQMVAYLVLDAQTNQLGFADLSVDKAGNATVVVDWSGIEPFYRDATPAVAVVVSRTGLKRITFRAKGAPKPIGAVPAS